MDRGAPLLDHIEEPQIQGENLGLSYQSKSVEILGGRITGVGFKLQRRKRSGILE
jgi:hypothetical protein